MGDTQDDTIQTRIRNMIAESDKFQAEQRKLIAEAEKFSAEQRNLYAEALKHDRERALAPWRLSVLTAGAVAAMFSAVVTALHSWH